jgi:hypothetical protein
MSTNAVSFKKQELLCPSFILQLIVYNWYVHDILADSSRSCMPAWSERWKMNEQVYSLGRNWR